MLIGYYTTQAIAHVAEGVEIVLLVASVLFISALVFWGRHLLKRLELQEDDTPTQ